MRSGKDRLGRAVLHDAAQVEHGDAIGQVAHHSEVVRDEDVGHPLTALQVGEEIEDGCLHRDVEGRGGLVADEHAWRPGERPCDGDSLLESSRELIRAQREMALLHPNRTDDFQEAPFRGLARETRQLLERPRDDVTHAVAPVQRRVGVLEDDLHRLQLLAVALGALGGERDPLELDHRSLVRHGETEQNARKRRLAAARFAHQSERLARLQVEVDPDDGSHVLAADVEGLGHAAQADDGLFARGRAPQLDLLGRRAGQFGCPVVVVAPRRPRRGDLVHRRSLFDATVGRERAALGEDASDGDLPGSGEEAGDRVEPPMILALPAAGDASQQSHGVGMLGIVEDLTRRALFDELSRVHDADAVAHLRDHRQVVADEQDRGLEPLAKRRHQVEHLGLDGGVKGCRRLVEYEQSGLRSERHGDHDPLQHPARKLMGIGVQHPSRIGDLHHAEQFLSPGQGVCSFCAGHLVHLGHLASDSD